MFLNSRGSIHSIVSNFNSSPNVFCSGSDFSPLFIASTLIIKLLNQSRILSFAENEQQRNNAHV